MAEYIKTIPSVDTLKFKQGIDDSSIVPVVISIVFHSGEGTNNLHVFFDASLSAGEETTLDGLIAAHDSTVTPLTPLQEFNSAVSREDGSRSGVILSTSESTLVFNEQMAANEDYLSISSFAHSDAGYVMPDNGRIVKLSGRVAKQPAGTKYLDLLVNDTIFPAELTFSATGAESQYSSVTDVPFLAGERIRAKTRMGNGVKLHNMNVVVWIRWEI